MITFATLKKGFIYILSIILLLSVSVDLVSDFWVKTVDAIEIVENGETENSKENKNETKDSNEKIMDWLVAQQNAKSHLTLFTLNHIYFKTSTFLSLPDIPPELV